VVKGLAVRTSSTALAIVLISSLTNGAAGEQQGVKVVVKVTDDSVTLRYRVPMSNRADESSAERWGLAAPVVDGCSDPNRIVYDEAYVEKYVQWAISADHVDGMANYEIVLPEGGKTTFYGGMDELYLGRRFRAEDLMGFLKTRLQDVGEERDFTVKNKELVRIARKFPERVPGGRLRWSPWERDLYYAISLVSQARYAPAYPTMKALAKDRSPTIRGAAMAAMGRMAKVAPQAPEDLAEFLDHPEDLSRQEISRVLDALTAADGLAIPVLIEAMDHENEFLRNQAVHKLPWMTYADAAPAVVAALTHERAEVRGWGTSALHDIQSRGKEIRKDPSIREVVAALADLLADDSRDTRRSAALNLLILGPAAAPAKSALEKAAREDPSSSVRDFARRALQALPD
jgi:HEAT repeat protein